MYFDINPPSLFLCVCTIHSLSSNQIGETGAKDLADAMKLNSSVTRLK
jgi:hypothetical protein